MHFDFTSRAPSPFLFRFRSGGITAVEGESRRVIGNPTASADLFQHSIHAREKRKRDSVLVDVGECHFYTRSISDRNRVKIDAAGPYVHGDVALSSVGRDGSVVGRRRVVRRRRDVVGRRCGCVGGRWGANRGVADRTRRRGEHRRVVSRHLSAKSFNSVPSSSSNDHRFWITSAHTASAPA